MSRTPGIAIRPAPTPIDATKNIPFDEEEFGAVWKTS